MTPTDYKLTQAQYAHIYGVTERSIRTYQGQGVPLDGIGNTLLILLDRKTRPPGLRTAQEARLIYNREAGIETTPTAARLEQFGELAFQFWDAHSALVAFVREHNLPKAEEIASVVAGVSGMVQRMRTLARLPELQSAEG